MTDRAAPGAPGAVLRRALALALAMADFFLIARWLTDAMPIYQALGLHLILVAGFILITLALRRGLATAALLGLILILLGPPGGLLLFALELCDDGAGEDLDNRRDAIALGQTASRARAIYHDIRQNRRPLLDGALPHGFTDVLDAGTMPERYRVISAISRHYRPEMLVALRHALSSPVPVLRVQAAAVYAKLRGDFGDEADDLLSAPATGVSAAAAREMVMALHRVAESGFVDDELQARLRERAETIAAQAASGAAIETGPGMGARVERPPRLAAAAARMMRGAG
ncbi:MAG: hypothetical protein ACK5MQ_00205 [Pikeienuella sp.]